MACLTEGYCNVLQNEMRTGVRKEKQKKSIEKTLLFGYDRKQCKKTAPEMV